ncbi:MAG: hypothetical protein H6Q69_3622 [Firmicutes bacterium]|nr:hypothetical protein [Bacillota bacterium]
MDRITKSLLDEFVNDNSLGTLTEEKAFEHFSSYLAVSSHYTASFSSDDIVVGAGGDCGIDGIAIIVNGNFVTEPEEIDDLAKTNTYLDVTFILVQSERSSSFETTKIGQFGFGVTDFFAEKSSLPQNGEIQLRHKITNEIFSKSSYFKKGNPQCFLFYVTTGKWVNDPNLVARRDSVIKDLEGLSLFKKVDFECIGADRLQDLYRKAKNSISTEVILTDQTVLPEIPGIQQAYIGLMPVSEFLKLIENDQEEIIHSIFYDNVRDWQEWNPVNNEIKNTLENSNNQIYFPLLNNGITVVAKRIVPTGKKFFIEDYSIVNGCQSSNVLHQTKSYLNDNVLVPVKLIATTDIEIKNMITKATNRQTEVTEDQLFALSDFPKKLEDYFPTFENSKKLYYERRPMQYNAFSGIEKVRIINMTTLVRAFASIYLDKAHRTTRNYKALLKSFGTDIFNKDHKLVMYYLAGYAHYRLEYLFRCQFLSSDLKPARYHILMAFRYIANSSSLPRCNSNDMDRYCNVILEYLWDDTKYKELFKKAADIVITTAAGNLHRDNIRTESFTEELIEELSKLNN